MFVDTLNLANCLILIFSLAFFIDNINPIHPENELIIISLTKQSKINDPFGVEIWCLFNTNVTLSKYAWPQLVPIPDTPVNDLI